jgi:hypothetical protein
MLIESCTEKILGYYITSESPYVVSYYSHPMEELSCKTVKRKYRSRFL